MKAAEHENILQITELLLLSRVYSKRLGLSLKLQQLQQLQVFLPVCRPDRSCSSRKQVSSSGAASGGSSEPRLGAAVGGEDSLWSQHVAAAAFLLLQLQPVSIFATSSLRASPAERINSLPLKADGSRLGSC